MAENDNIALQIELQSALPEHRGVVFRTFVDRDCSAHELNALMDKLREVVDRQLAFAEVEKWEGNVLNEERLAAQHARNLAVVQENVQRKWTADNRRGEARLSASEENERRAAHANLEMSKDNIAMGKKKIEFYKQRINGHAVT